MKMLKLVMGWIVGVWRFLTRPLMTVAMLVVLGGCVTPDASIQTLHGVTGKVSTIWADVDVRPPTILQKNETALHSKYGAEVKSDMPGTYSVDAAGNISSTGVPSYILVFIPYLRALTSFCEVAGNHPLCTGEE